MTSPKETGDMHPMGYEDFPKGVPADKLNQAVFSSIQEVLNVDLSTPPPKDSPEYKLMLNILERTYEYISPRVMQVSLRVKLVLDNEFARLREAIAQRIGNGQATDESRKQAEELAKKILDRIERAIGTAGYPKG